MDNKQITAGELYEYTMVREETISNKGFNMVSVWEADFRVEERK